MDEVKKTSREKYIDELSDKLKDWDRDLEELEARLNKEFDELKSEYSDKVAELNELRSQLENKLDKLEDAGKEAFESVKEDVEVLWIDSKRALNAFKKELKNE